MKEKMKKNDDKKREKYHREKKKKERESWDFLPAPRKLLLHPTLLLKFQK